MIVPLTRTTKIQKIRTGYIRSANTFISVVENLVEVQEVVIIPQRSTNRKRLRRYGGRNLLGAHWMILYEVLLP